MYSYVYAMGQQRIKRSRRDIRKRIVSDTIKHIQWCQDNVTVREDGVDRPITVGEAAEFIYLTSHQPLTKSTSGNHYHVDLDKDKK